MITFQYISASRTFLALSRYFALLTFIVLVGCETTPQIEDNTQVLDLILPTPSEIEDWTARGKISLKFNDKTTNANLVWTSRGKDYEIRLFGPIGIGAASLQRDGDSVKLKSKDGEYEAASGEELLQTHLGLFLPIEEMHSWIKGLPFDGKLIQQGWSENSQGEFTSLQQSGWKIQFSNREDHPKIDSTRTLPGKVRVNFPGDQKLGPVKILVVIKDWNINT